MDPQQLVNELHELGRLAESRGDARLASRVRMVEGHMATFVAQQGAAKLPPYIYGREAGPNEKVWTEDAVRGVLRAVPASVELPDDGELEAWRQAADTLLSRKDPGQHELRRAAMLLQNAYLFASKLRGTPGVAMLQAKQEDSHG